MHRKEVETKDQSIDCAFIYVIACLRSNSSSILSTIFTSYIFNRQTSRVHKSRYTAITSSLNHNVAMQLAIAEGYYAANLRFATLGADRSYFSYRKGFTLNSKDSFGTWTFYRRNARFDKANEPNQTKSRTITLRYDTPFYRSYY